METLLTEIMWVPGEPYRNLLFYRTVLSGASSNRTHDLLETVDNCRHPVDIEFVDRVLGMVVPRIAERRRIGHHQRRVSRLPERPVIGPADAGKSRGCCGGFDGKRSGGLECLSRPVQESLALN